MEKKEYQSLKEQINQELSVDNPNKYTIQQLVGALSVIARQTPELYGDYATFILDLPKKYRVTINPYDSDWGSEEMVDYLKVNNINFLELLPVREYPAAKYRPFETNSNDTVFMGIHAEFSGYDPSRPALFGSNFDDNGVVTTDAHRLLFTPYAGERKDQPGIYCHTKKCISNIEQVEASQYPNYKLVVPENPYKVLINAAGLYNYLKNMLNMGLVSSISGAIGIQYKEENINVAVNAEYLLEAISAMMKLGHQMLEFSLSPEKDRAIVIYPHKEGDKVKSLKTDFALVMPIVGEYDEGVYTSAVNIENACMHFIGSENEFCFDLVEMERQRKDRESAELKSDLTTTKNKLTKLEELEAKRKLDREQKLAQKAEREREAKEKLDREQAEDLERRRKVVEGDLDELIEILESN